MRKNLKILRIKLGLSMDEMAQRIGCTRPTYASYEYGEREGRQKFWEDLQRAFKIPDEEMFKLMKNYK